MCQQCKVITKATVFGVGYDVRNPNFQIHGVAPAPNPGNLFVCYIILKLFEYIIVEFYSNVFVCRLTEQRNLRLQQRQNECTTARMSQRRNKCRVIKTLQK